jgi:hypothetical protein
MRHKKAKRKPLDLTHALVKKEMAKPRMAKSARIMERNLTAGRIVERPSITMPGTVDKIIPSRHRSQPDKAHIGVDNAARRYRNLRIENSLTDENGDEVKLRKGAHVEVTVAAEGETSTAKIMEDG